MRQTNEELKEIGRKCLENKALYNVAYMRMSNNTGNKKPLSELLNKKFSNRATKEILLATGGQG